MKSWLLASRPKTLTAALVPIVVGTALAYAVHGQVQLYLSLFALLSSLFIQIGTNLINDAADFRRGADTHERMGPIRVTQSGLLTSNQVWWGGLACFLIASLLAAPLIYVGGKTIIIIGILSLIAGYIYTDGPFPLAYHGLGDLFVFFFFGWVAVGGMYFLHTGAWDAYAIAAACQVGFLATVLIAINNLRDRETDLKSNKRTMAVRFGVFFSKMDISFLIIVPFVLGFFWMEKRFLWAVLLPLLALPLAINLMRKIWKTPPGVIYNRYLAQSSLLHLGFGVLLSIGLMIGR